ncbi:MAG: 3-dehydroquinate synthase [Armatimonadaceae bacterium]
MPETAPNVAPDSRIPALHVALSRNRDYPIYIGAKTLADAGKIVAQAVSGRRLVVITQPGIEKRWGEALRTGLVESEFCDVPFVSFAAGERFKTMATVERLCDKLYDLPVPLDRKTTVLALGGGVVGDVAGFVAAIYLRGLNYIQIPTTLLAMVDSSVGGKTGVDFHAGKNLIGAFHQPRAVLIDTDTLQTLPIREFCAGMAEVIKYGVIRDPQILTDVGTLAKLPAGGSAYNALLAHLIRRSCEIKAEVVVQDEHETTGLRAILNFGHTLGHAVEAATGYNRFKHGEAVGIGMLAAARLGETLGVTPPEVYAAIYEALVCWNLPTAIPGDLSAEGLISLTARDKKAEGGRARFVLAERLGKVSLYADIEESAVRSAIESCRETGSSSRTVG